MSFSIATWNINSVRLRIDLVLRFLKERRPDVLCLQETKCPNEFFPFEAFRAAGYEHVEVHGQKGYHGVATLSTRPLEDLGRRDFCAVGDSRHLSSLVRVGGIRLRIHNIYLPAGGDAPDPEINPKFRHKLDFLQELQSLDAEAEEATEAMILGDLNVAPLETDVWSHKQLLKVVSHTPVEVEALLGAMTAGRWCDLVRQHFPADEKVFTWWSYRARDWAASNRGRRLDHIWSSAGLAGRLSSAEVLTDARGWDRPSDHVPVIVTLDL